VYFTRRREEKRREREFSETREEKYFVAQRHRRLHREEKGEKLTSIQLWKGSVPPPAQVSRPGDKMREKRGSGRCSRDQRGREEILTGRAS